MLEEIQNRQDHLAPPVKRRSDNDSSPIAPTLGVQRGWITHRAATRAVAAHFRWPATGRFRRSDDTGGDAIPELVLPGGAPYLSIPSHLAERTCRKTHSTSRDRRRGGQRPASDRRPARSTGDGRRSEPCQGCLRRSGRSVRRGHTGLRAATRCRQGSSLVAAWVTSLRRVSRVRFRSRAGAGSVRTCAGEVHAVGVEDFGIQSA